MSIDWITVSAQVVNFLVLIWLLKRFLYQPVLRAMDRREQRIAERLSEAQERKQSADEEGRQYRQKIDELEAKRYEILSEAEAEAQQRKRQMLDEAREEVAETRANWQHQAHREKRELLGNLRREAANVIQAIARKALRDLADLDLEQHIVANFIRRLGSLDEDARAAMAGTPAAARIVTAFELDSTARSRLTRALHENLRNDLDIEYERSPDLLCGIELTANAQRLTWSLSAYMDELTSRIEKAFDQFEPVTEEN